MQLPITALTTALKVSNADESIFAEEIMSHWVDISRVVSMNLKTYYAFRRIKFPVDIHVHCHLLWEHFSVENRIRLRCATVLPSSLIVTKYILCLGSAAPPRVLNKLRINLHRLVRSSGLCTAG